ncbi:MAG: hypothetical protein GX877_02965 [Bacteroidales bacterium]|nr:hypothetical protein [Bacteroidales bacterium]
MRFRHGFLMLLLFTLFFNCDKVTDLNDHASVTECSITDVVPQTVRFGDPSVKEGGIVLPMEYGKYEFPVTVTLNIGTAQTIDKILGWDTENTLTFETEDTVRRIHLIALSGVPHSYEVIIEVAPLSDQASVLSAQLESFAPKGFLLSSELEIDVVESQVCIYALSGQVLPLQAELYLELSPGAILDSMGETALENVGEGFLSLSLESYNTSVPFTVIAESGKKETWSVQLAEVLPIHESSQADPGVWERLQPNGPMALIFRTEGPKVVDLETDYTHSRGVATVKDAGIPFPWEASLSFDLAPYVLVIGENKAQDFTVVSWEQEETFYLTDMISRVARPWIFSWKKWLNTANDVLSFLVVEYESELHEMVLGTPVVDTLSGVVEIPFTEGKDFPLEIKEYVMSVSEDATSDLPSTFLFESYKDKVPFSITSEAGTCRPWELRLLPWFETEAEILALEVSSYQSAENLVQLKSTSASIDKKEQTVSLTLKAGYDFPFVIEKFHLELSSGAVLLETFKEGIVFQTIEQVVPLTVMAESGDCKEWLLILEDERIEVTEALVLGYKIDSYSGTSQTQNNIELQETGRVDTLAHTVTLVINDWSVKMPVTVNGVLELSKNATADGDITALEHTLVFENPEQKFHFSVTSESGTNRTEWTLQLEDRSCPRNSEADVIDFITGNPSSGFVFDQKYLERDKASITLLVSARPSREAVLTIRPTVVLSEGARIHQGLIPGAPLEVSFNTPCTFYVMSEDETEREWKVQMLYAPQVANSSFEQWTTIDGVFNIWPSNGKGWISGNNVQVSGCLKSTGRDGTHAVQLLTQLKTVNLIVMKVTSLTAGALLLGNFNFSMSADAVMNPSSMPDFGIVFGVDVNPVGFEVEYNYKAGEQRVHTEPFKTAFGTPDFKAPKKIEGRDRASIIVELHRFTGNKWAYDPKNRVNMIAGYDLYSEGTDGWIQERYLFESVEGKENLTMTHLVVRCSSSWQGDEFKGAHGSSLLLDNFKLIYYLPSTHAKILN